MVAVSTLMLLLLFSSALSTNSNNITNTNLNQLNYGSIENIRQYLTYSEQSKSRLINEHFNLMINQSHSAIKDNLQRVSWCIDRIFGPGPEETTNETESTHRLMAMQELQSLEDALIFNELYIRSWPISLEKCIYRNKGSLPPICSKKL